MKRVLLVMLAVIMAMLLLYPVTLADSEVDPKLQNAVVVVLDSPWALVNNKVVEIDTNHSVTPYVNSDDRTMVPVRFISEAFKGTIVNWEEKTETVVINAEAKTIKFSKGKNAVTVNGKSTEIDTAAVLEGERIYVPLRAIGEALGKEVFYDRGLIILSDTKDIYNPETDRATLDEIFIKTNAIPTVGSVEGLHDILNDASKSIYGDKDEEVYYSVAEESKTILSGGGNGGGGPTVRRDFTESGAAGGGAVSGAGGSAATATAPGAVMNDTATPPVPMDEPASMPMVTSSTEAESDGDYSKTNTQVGGVDEADVVKTDGTNIYYLKSDGTLTITQAVPADKLKVLASMTFTNSNFNPQEMYVDGDDLILIGIRYIYPNDGEPYSSDTGAKQQPYTNGNARIMPVMRPSGMYVTTAYVYSAKDIINNTVKAEARIIDVEGNYISSRKVGSNVYIATNKYIGYYYGDTDDNEIMPYYGEINPRGVNANGYVSCEKIRYFPNIRSMQYLVVAAFNIDKPEQKVDVSAYLGAGDNMYMSADNMFIARTVNDYYYNENKEGTEIFKFGLADVRLSYKGKGEVPGNILNQFSMDEHKGFFRIATTEHNYSAGSNKETNNVYILDGDLEITGKINEIAPGEKIYSTRFMGDKMYMVTFKQIDPLFVIDLSDPYEPKILGKLKIPGYSDYLHPYDENHIIGFGKDAEIYEDSIWAYQQGMKMAMFDVSDLENPKELFNVSIGDRGTESELLHNHKALLFSKEKNIIAFPATIMKKAESDKSSVTAYGQFEFQGGLVYSVDMDEGFTLKGTITHITEEEYLKSGKYWGYSDKNLKRMLYIGNTIYGLSDYGISSHDLDNISKLDMTTYENK